MEASAWGVSTTTPINKPVVVAKTMAILVKLLFTIRCLILINRSNLLMIVLVVSDTMQIFGDSYFK